MALPGEEEEVSPGEVFDPSSSGLDSVPYNDDPTDSTPDEEPVTASDPTDSMQIDPSKLGTPTHEDNGDIVYPQGITVSPAKGLVTVHSGNSRIIYDGYSGKKIDIQHDAPPHIIKMKDDSGLDLPYTIQDGKLVRVPLDGEDLTKPKAVPAEGATGDDAIKELSPQDQSLVKGYASYALVPPAGSASRNPTYFKLYPFIQAYRPDFAGLQGFKEAQQTRLQYRSSTPGVAGGQIVSANTAVDHLGQLWEAAQKLNQTEYTKYNTIQQYLEAETGNPDVVAYNTILGEVNKEIERAFLGGVPTAMNQQEAINNLKASRSPEQLKAAITQALPNLLSARLGEIGYNYEKVFGKPFDGLVRPNARKVLDGFGIKDFATEGGGAEESAPPAPAPKPVPTNWKPGDTIKDKSSGESKTYTGKNPSNRYDPINWE